VLETEMIEKVRIAAGLRNFLRMAPNEIEFEGRRISRDTLLRAANILEAGPTTTSL
jgi:hypothetical protein